MEEMLQNFTSLGMTDIAFLVVNSKKERSQKLLPQLEATVSFPVFQETTEEQVWSVLRGGKDDMFVYDRCGRLVAYIPFPLSLLDSDQSLVSNFILYAYNVDPCDGVTPCGEMETGMALPDIGTEAHFLNNAQEGNYEQQNQTSRTNEMYPETINELLHAINETTGFNNIMSHTADHSSENISHSEIQNHTVFQHIINSIWEIQNLDQNNTSHTNLSTTDISALSVEQNLNETVCNNSNNCNPAKPIDTNDISDLTLDDIKPTETIQSNPKRICVAEDEKVCEQWSKRQLKRIQRCCAHIDNELNDGINTRHENMCESFKKKRCKKMRTVIKCCLKMNSPDEENTDETQSFGKQGSTDSPEIELHNHAEKAMEKVP